MKFSNIQEPKDANLVVYWTMREINIWQNSQNFDTLDDIDQHDAWSHTPGTMHMMPSHP